MSGENGAVPKVEVVVNSSVESTTSASSVPARVVQGTVLSRAAGTKSKWKWSEKKKEALRLVLSGASITEVSKRLKVHRNTVTNWTKTPEWLAETKRSLEEEQLSSRLRRVKTTALLTDRLGAAALGAMNDDLAKVDPTRLGLALREHLNYVKAERDLYGENGEQRNAQGTAININLGGPGGPAPVASEHQATALTAFSVFLEAYDPKLAVAARSPQEAAALLAEKVLQESNLLDIIREEDRETLRQEAEVEEATKRRR